MLKFWFYVETFCKFNKKHNINLLGLITSEISLKLFSSNKVLSALLHPGTRLRQAPLYRISSAIS